MNVRPKLEAMTDDELRAERDRLNAMLDDDENYVQDIDGRRWCFERLKKIDELLPDQAPKFDDRPGWQYSDKAFGISDDEE